MKGLIILNKDTKLVLKAKTMMRKEDIEEQVRWFREKMGLDVKIIDCIYDIEGIVDNGKRVGKEIL